MIWTEFCTQMLPRRTRSFTDRLVSHASPYILATLELLSDFYDTVSARLQDTMSVRELDDYKLPQSTRLEDQEGSGLSQGQRKFRDDNNRGALSAGHSWIFQLGIPELARPVSQESAAYRQSLRPVFLVKLLVSDSPHCPS